MEIIDLTSDSESTSSIKPLPRVPQKRKHEGTNQGPVTMPVIDMEGGVPSRFRESKPNAMKRRRRFFDAMSPASSNGSSGRSFYKYSDAAAHVLVHGFPPEATDSIIKKAFQDYGVMIVDRNENKSVTRVCFGTRGKRSYHELDGKVLTFEQFIVECSKVFHHQDEKNLFSVGTIDYDAVLGQVAASNCFEDQVQLLVDELLLSAAELDQRNKVVEFFEAHKEFGSITGNLYLMGSTANGTGFKDSDMDCFLHLHTFSEEDEMLFRDMAVTLLDDLHPFIKNVFQMSIIQPIDARVPIIKLHFSRKPGIVHGLKADICCGSFLGVYNSCLIKFFCDSEPLFHALAIIIKLWAKLKRITMTSYSLNLLVIFYCQSQDLLPSLQSMQTSSEGKFIEDEDYADGTKVSYRVDFSLEPFASADKKKPPLSELLIDFFRFYENFDYGKYVISPFYGKCVSKVEFRALHIDFPLYSNAAVQDFFELRKNLAECDGYLSQFRACVRGLHTKLDMNEEILKEKPHLIIKLMFNLCSRDDLRATSGPSLTSVLDKKLKALREEVEEKEEKRDIIALD